MVPRTVLTKSGPISLNTAKLVNTVQSRTAVNNAGPMKNVIDNAYSTARRPFNIITATNNSNFTKNVNTVKGTRVNTTRPKAVLSAVKGNKGNAIKALACWVWRPKHKVLDHGNPQQDLKDKGVINSGCYRHMTGNRSYLTYYEEIDRGFVAFGGNSIGGKMTGKGIIRTSKLDFKDVYFVKELKFNLFSVSQMYDKKNSVPYTDTECVVLSPYFKLTDESRVLLKVPRKDNMYSVYLKNVVPQGGLTYLFAKATPNESNLWHRRLGHVNIKTMNKLVRGNLVRGRKPALSYIRPFGCPVTILNTIDHLGKFDRKADERFFVGYSTNSKAFRVFNSRTRIVEGNLHVQFSENTPNIARSGPNWLFDIDALTKSMNYKPVVTGNQSNGSVGTKACDDACKARMDTDSPDTGFKPSKEEEKKDVEDPGNEDSEFPSIEEPRVNQEKDANDNSTNTINTVSPTVNVVGIEDNVVDENIVYGCADDLNMPELEDIVYSDDDEDVGAEADMNNLVTFMTVSPILTTKIHKDHPVEQISADIHSAALNTRMDVKSAFLYGKIEEEVCVVQPPRFKDPDFPTSIHSRKGTLWISSSSRLLILKKFGFSDVKTACTPMETHTPLLKDEDGEDVDEHLYRSMIGSLMYLTSSRPDIMYSPFDLGGHVLDSDYVRSKLIMEVHQQFSVLQDYVGRVGDAANCSQNLVRIVWQYYRMYARLGCDTRSGTIDITDDSDADIAYVWYRDLRILDHASMELCRCSLYCARLYVLDARDIESGRCFEVVAVGEMRIESRDNGYRSCVSLGTKRKLILSRDPSTWKMLIGVGLSANATSFEQHTLMGDETSVRQESKKVLDLETSKTTQALEMESLKRRVKKLDEEEMI
ncbi:ribonuclease H-like domain-containing protein [Tanacetum coccineum]